MAMPDLKTIAFAIPGGESSPPSRARPIDLVHLARQTLGDRSVEQEVLALFVQQAGMVRDRIGAASAPERASLAHGLRGSAAGIGAFAVAEAATAVERNPSDGSLLPELTRHIDEVRQFIAAICR